VILGYLLNEQLCTVNVPSANSLESPHRITIHTDQYAIADIQTPALRRGAAGAPVVAVCSEALCDVAFSSRMSGRDVRDDVIFLLRV